MRPLRQATIECRPLTAEAKTVLVEQARLELQRLVRAQQDTRDDWEAFGEIARGQV